MKTKTRAPACREYMRRCPPVRPLIVHVASGSALALLFVGALHGTDATMARLLWEVGGLFVLVVLFLLHAGLFACASLATATGLRADCDGGGSVGCEAEATARQPPWRARTAQPARRSPRPGLMREARRQSSLLATAANA